MKKPIVSLSVVSSPESFLEPLEDRIAPAGLVTFSDTDGDVVQVKSSKGTNADLQAALHITDGQLQSVDFANNPLFQGTNLDITVKTKSATGDGFVNVGLIDAHGVDLGSVLVKGDLGKILVGDNVDTSAAMKSLTVQSIGLKGTSTQADGDTDLSSVIIGSTQTVKVNTSIKDASLAWLSYATSPTFAEGVEHTNLGHAGVSNFSIGKDLNGKGDYSAAGSIYIDGSVQSFTVGGSIVGGGNDFSGVVQAHSFNTIKIGGSLTGAGGDYSGQVIIDTSLNGSMTVGGNLTGGFGDESGQIIIAGKSNSNLTIGGNIVGGEGANTGGINLTGKFSAISVGGSILGSTGNHSGFINDFSVKTLDGPSSLNSVSKLAIGGSIYGGEGGNSGIIGVDIVGAFTVGGNISAVPKVLGGSIDPEEATGAASVHFGTATSIVVGGNLVGSASDFSGSIQVDSNITSFQLKGSVLGGDGEKSGSIQLSATGLSKSTIGGSLRGGDGLGTGSIILSGEDATHSLAIGGKVVGGGGERSGSVFADENISSLTVGSDVVGGSGEDSGVLDLVGHTLERGPDPVIPGLLTTLSIGGSLLGGVGEGSAAVYLGTATTVSVGADIQGTNDGTARILAESITTMKVGGDIIGGEGEESGQIEYDTAGTLGGSLFVGGSLIGGGGATSGAISASGLTSATVEGSIIGGEGFASGDLYVTGLGLVKTPVKDKDGGKNKQTITTLAVNIGGDIIGGYSLGAGSVQVDSAKGSSPSVLTMTVGGDILGGSEQGAGTVTISMPTTSLKVTGSVIGGTGEGSGSLQFSPGSSSQAIGLVSIGGSLIGGTNSSGSGSILAFNNTITSLQIGGDVVGGDGSDQPMDSEGMTNSGMILARALTSVNVGGSLIAGQTGNEGDLNLGAIRTQTIGTLKVAGSITGNADNPFLITALGFEPTASLKKNLAISSIDVLGDVEYANILSGYDVEGTTINGDGGLNGTAQIGTVHVGGDWTASSLAAGVSQGDSGEWGTSSNVLLDKFGSNIVASIASIVIDGVAKGQVGDSDTQHGFVAEQIASLSVGGFSYTVPANPGFVQVGPDADLVARLAVVVDDNSDGNDGGGVIV